jgi:hypothetical protein
MAELMAVSLVEKRVVLWVGKMVASMADSKVVRKVCCWVEKMVD